MPLFEDQLGRRIDIKKPPRRIVSVVPSQTEYLYDLGLEEEVIGITKFCIHPESWFRYKTRIGGTKNLKLDKIAELQPDLIIANKEENTQAEIEALAEQFPVWISDISNLNEALEMMISIGEICEKQEKANNITDCIKSSFEAFQPILNNASAAYLIWKDPYMAAGAETFINDLLNRCGFTNCLEGRYPNINTESLKELNPEFILLSSEPYPFKQKHIDELQAICPDSKILLVDGEYFSWYGSRLLGTTRYFDTLEY